MLTLMLDPMSPRDPDPSYKGDTDTQCDREAGYLQFTSLLVAKMMGELEARQNRADNGKTISKSSN